MLRKILENALGGPAPDPICAAIKAGVPVVVGGSRKGPTGKTYLCDQLRAIGVKAYEQWEFEEGSAQWPAGCNRLYLSVDLMEPISPEFYKNMGNPG